MRTRLAVCSLALVGGITTLAIAQAKPSVATQPSATTRPADPRTMTSDQMLGQMLRPANPGQPKPLQPMVDAPATDKKSGPGAVKPNAPVVATLREGTFIVDRLGRLTKNADGLQAEFVFDVDSKAMKDPPVIILPNLKLMAMENAVAGASRDLHFRVTGMVTEYRGRNYVLLEKVLVVPDVAQQF